MKRVMRQVLSTPGLLSILHLLYSRYTPIIIYETVLEILLNSVEHLYNKNAQDFVAWGWQLFGRHATN